MSGAIKICTAWKRTGALRIRSGWLGPVAEFEETRQTGRTFGPGCGHWNAGIKALRDNDVVAQSGDILTLTSLFHPKGK